MVKTRLMAVLDDLASSRWFAYGTLLLLQFKVVFGMWLYRDLTSGDTADYFVMAFSWHTIGQAPIHWSPLYTGFYGLLLNISPDAYFVTILHRLIIVFVASALVLALMRRLLPHSAAWLIAAWWVALPNTFDAFSEVHLFAVIPALIAYLLVLYKPTIWTRGAALGVFLVSAFLSRNEFFIAVALWALVCLVWEIYSARRSKPLPLLVYLRAYGLPILLALMLVVFFYWRSSIKYPLLAESLAGKHTLNVCQVYAFNYQQRYSDWMQNPFLYCDELMTRDFGVPQPSMTEAIRLNPRAMLDFFLWNARLIPEGVQMLLFNATSGSENPDYIARILESRWSARLSVLALGVVAVGVWLLRRNGWWQIWIKPRFWGWLVLFCILVVMVVVMLTQRPRPSYLFNLFFLLTAIIGLCGAAIIERWFGLKRFARLLPFIAVAFIVFVPSYFTPTYRNPGGYPNRPLLEHYQHLAPFQALVTAPETRVVGTGWLNVVCLYFGTKDCQTVDYPTLMAQKPADQSLADALAQENINLFYADEAILADPAAQEFLQNSDREGWDTLVSVQTGVEQWRLLQRR